MRENAEAIKNVFTRVSKERVQHLPAFETQFVFLFYEAKEPQLYLTDRVHDADQRSPCLCLRHKVCVCVQDGIQQLERSWWILTHVESQPEDIVLCAATICCAKVLEGRDKEKVDIQGSQFIADSL